MSVVYRGTDTASGGRVAIKLLNGIMVTDQESSQRFHREMQIARGMMHPNVCTLLDHGVTSEGTPFHIMEFIEGETLEQLLGELGAIDPLEGLQILIKTCRAAQYLHSRGIVHRDLKPSNIMIPVSESGQLSVKLIDFGVAKGTKSGVPQSLELTRPGEVFGSLLYTAPERLTGQQADARSDIYSLGCVIYETISGRNPFSADSPSEIVERQLKYTPEPMQRSGLPSAVAMLFQPIVSKALDKSPIRRYQTAAQLKEALEALETPLKLTYMRTAGKSGEGSRRRARHMFALAAAGKLLVGMVAVAAIVIVVIHHFSGGGWHLPWGIRL